MNEKLELKDYLSPTVEIVGVEVETGFAGSIDLDSTPYDPSWN